MWCTMSNSPAFAPLMPTTPISEGSFGSLPGWYTVALNNPEVSTIVLETDLARILATICVRGPGGGQSTNVAN